MPAASPLSLAAGAGLDVYATNQTLETVTGGGFITNSQNSSAILALGGAADFSFGGVIADNSANLVTPLSRLALTKEGASVLTLSLPQLYAGVTTINSGVINLTGTALPGTGNVVFGSGTSPELRLSRTDSFTLANVLEGGGQVTMAGSGTATLTALNPLFNGTLSVDAGTVVIGDGATSGSIGTAGLVFNGGTVRFNRTDAPTLADPTLGLTIAGVVSGNGAIVQAGTGGTTFAPSSSTFTGTVAVDAGTLILGTTDALAGASSITVASGGRIEFALDQTLGDGIANLVDVTINGTAVLNTTGASAQIGDLTVNGGVLSGTSSFGSGSFGFNGAVLVTQDATF
ncbi:MAG: autotransporter-associated beta strand repeat-containing protein, partial [Opitutia bacterium]